MHLESLEALTLAQCLADPAQYMEIADRLNPGMFWNDAHRAIFEGMKSAYDEGIFFLEAVDARAPVKDEAPLYQIILGLAAKGRKEPGDVESLFGPLIDRHIKSECGRVFDKAQKTAGELSAAEMIDRTMRELEALRNGAETFKATSYAEAQAEVFEYATKASQGEASVISCGMPQVDRLIGGGFAPAEMTVLLARGGAGKTALAYQWAESIAERGGPGYFGSYEMHRAQLISRRLSGRVGISMRRLRSGLMTDAELEKLYSEGLGRSKVPLWFDDKEETTIEQLRRRVASMKRRFGIKMVVVDSIKAMHVADARLNTDLVRRAGSVIKQLKSMAKESEVHVISLAHETRGNRPPMQRPTRQNAFGGSNMEDDPDNVLVLHRPEPHLKEQMPQDTGSIEFSQMQADLLEWENRARVYTDKVRMGAVGGYCDLTWDGERTQFSERVFAQNDGAYQDALGL